MLPAPFGLVRLSGPQGEPVSLDEARQHLRVTDPVDDGIILGQLAAAREWCETWTGRSFLTQTWRLTLDVFPPGAPSAQWAEWSDWTNAGPIYLPRAAPLQAVSSVQYADGG